MEKRRKDMEHKKFIPDSYSQNFKDSASMMKELNELEENTTWESEVDSRSIEITAIDSPPLLSKEVADRLGCDEEAVLDTLNGGTGLAVTFNGKTYPMRNTAMKSALETAKVTGGVICRLNPSQLAELFKLCLSVATGKSLIQIRGNKVSAILSDAGNGFKHLPMSELIERTEESLQKRFAGKAKFVTGEISHEFMSAKYVIKEPSLLKEYEALTKDSMYSSTYLPALSVYSADIGTCSATVAPSLINPRGITIRVNEELRVAHKKNASIEMFSEKLEEVFAKYASFVKRLGELAEVNIEHSSTAFMLAAKKAGLPKKLATRALEDFQMYVGNGESTAHDIYMGLCEIVFYAKAKGCNEKELCRLEDLVARCLTYNWEEFDLPGEHKW